MRVNELVKADFSNSSYFIVKEIGNYSKECNVIIRSLDKKDVFENWIYTNTSCLHVVDKLVGVHVQLSLFD